MTIELSGWRQRIHGERAHRSTAGNLDRLRSSLPPSLNQNPKSKF
jgi:hypothetical protein